MGRRSHRSRRIVETGILERCENRCLSAPVSWLLRYAFINNGQFLMTPVQMPIKNKLIESGGPSRYCIKHGFFVKTLDIIKINNCNKGDRIACARTLGTSFVGWPQNGPRKLPGLRLRLCQFGTLSKFRWIDKITFSFILYIYLYLFIYERY